MEITKDLKEKIAKTNWALINLKEDDYDKYILEKIMQDCQTFSITIRCRGRENLEALLKSYVFDCLQKTIKAEKIKEEIKKAKELIGNKSFHSIGQLNSALEECGLKLITEDDVKYQLSVIDLLNEPLKDFYFPKGEYDSSKITRKEIKAVCVFIKSYNAESFVNHFYFINKEEDTTNRMLFDYSEELKRELTSLFDTLR